MSNRPEPMTEAERAAIGRVVIAMRDNGVLWKEIAHELRMCERHLRRCAALAGPGGLMSDFSGRMSDLRDCEAQAAA